MRVGIVVVVVLWYAIDNSQARNRNVLCHCTLHSCSVSPMFAVVSSTHCSPSHLCLYFHIAARQRVLQKALLEVKSLSTRRHIDSHGVERLRSGSGGMPRSASGQVDSSGGDNGNAAAITKMTTSVSFLDPSVLLCSSFCSFSTHGLSARIRFLT